MKPLPPSSGSANTIHARVHKRTASTGNDESAATDAKRLNTANGTEYTVDTSNKYTVLTPTDDNKMEVTDDTTNAKITNTPKEKTQPIYIYTDNITQLKTFLKKTCPKTTLRHNVEYTTAKAGNLNEYTNLKTYLQSTQTDFHTYEIPSNRPIKVIAKHLPLEITTDEIKQELDELQIRTTSIRRFLKFDQKIKIPTTLVLITLPRTEADKIYKLRSLGHILITVEKYNPKPDTIPQCSKCLYFGHSSTNCFRTERCLRCGQSGHNRDNCTKTKDDTPTCANCGENHTAIYRGCAYYKELTKQNKERRQYRQETAKHQTPTPNKKDFPTLSKTKHTTPTLSYAAATNTQHTQNKLGACSTSNTGCPGIAVPSGSAHTTSTPTLTDNSEQESNPIKEILSLFKDLNLPKIILTIKVTLEKIKNATSTWDKISVLLEAVSNLI